MIYVLQVLTGSEDYVAGGINRHLLLDGERIVLPTFDQYRKYHGKERIIPQHIFPGYLFVLTDKVDSFELRLVAARRDRYLQTMMRFLRTGYTITPLADPEEQIFHTLFDQREHLGMSRGVIRDGKLQIQEGPLVGFEDRISRIDRHKRLAEIPFQLPDELVTIKIGLEITEKS